jgi:hypothetical protein
LEAGSADFALFEVCGSFFQQKGRKVSGKRKLSACYREKRIHRLSAAARLSQPLQGFTPMA